METNNQNLSPNPPQVQTIIPPNKWYKHKGLITIVVLIIIAAGVSYFALNKKDDTNCIAVVYGQYKNPQTGETRMFGGCKQPPAYWIKMANGNSNPNQQQNNSSATVNPSSTNISTWKTYSNTIYGVEIKYPSSLTVQDENSSSASLDLTNTATTTYWQGITIRLYNNPDGLSSSDWWSKNHTTPQQCASDPKQSKIAGYNSLETDTDAKCIQFPNDHFPQIRSIYVFNKSRIAEFDV